MLRKLCVSLLSVLISLNAFAVGGQRVKLYSNNSVVNQSLSTSEAGSITPLAITAPTCSTTGNQKAVAILLDLKDYALPSNITPEFVKGILFGNDFSTATNDTDWSLRDFLMQNSNNKFSLDAPNSVVVRLPVPLTYNYNGDSSSSTCDWQALENEAIAAASSSVDFSQYNRVIFVIPNNHSCGFSGLATSGCTTLTSPNGDFTASSTMLVADYIPDRQRGVTLAAKLFGYNLGLGNARLKDCSYISGFYSYYDVLGPLGGSCPNLNPDFFSAMAGGLGFYSAKHTAENLGWLESGVDYLVIQNNGTHTIQKYENNTPGIPKALKIQRGTGNDAWLWIEARSNANIYDTTLDPQVFDGALIHYQDSTTGVCTDLLDFTPFTDSITDVTLQKGKTWSDPYSNLVLTVNDETNDSLTVTATYLQSEPPCSVTAPVVSVSPTSVTLQPGSSTLLTATVTNPLTNCLNKKYLIYQGIPGSNWKVFFNNDPNLTSFYADLVAGQSNTSSVTVQVPVGTAPGQYGVTVRAQDSSNLNNPLYGFKLAVIYVPISLSVAITGTGTVASSPAGISCPGTCSAPFKANAPVVLTATPTGTNNTTTWSCSGCQTVTKTGTTSSYTLSVGQSNINMSVKFTYVKPKGR